MATTTYQVERFAACGGARAVAPFGPFVPTIAGVGSMPAGATAPHATKRWNANPVVTVAATTKRHDLTSLRRPEEAVSP